MDNTQATSDTDLPDISIIVPIYNTKNFLRKCLDSILAQTLVNIEIICVDDKSPDDSYKIVEEYQKQDARVILIRHEQNLGLGGARNTGILAAKAKYIMGVDSDDYVEADMAELLYKAAISFDLDIVECGYSEITEDDQILSEYLPYRDNLEITDCINIFESTRFAFWNKLWRRSLYTNHDVFAPNKLYYEDLATTPRIIARSKRIGFVGKSLYNYVQRKKSITNTSSDKHLMDYLRVFDILADDLIQRGAYLAQRQNFIKLAKVNFDFIRGKLRASGSKSDQQLLQYTDVVEEGFFACEAARFAEMLASPINNEAKTPAVVESSNGEGSYKPLCAILSRYGEEEAVIRMKIGAIRQNLKAGMDFITFSNERVKDATCIIVNHLDSIEGHEEELINFARERPEAPVIAFISDFYPRVAHQMQRFDDFIDVYVVPTLEMKITMSCFSEKEIYVLPDPIDFCLEDSLARSHTRKMQLDVLWFGYSESFTKSMLEFSPLLEYMHSTRRIRYHIFTNSSGFDKKTNMLVHDYNVASFPQILPQFDLCVLSHVPNDFSMSTYSKSENKAVLSINRGVPVIASRTPSYERLLNSCGLSEYLFTSRKELEDSIERLEDDRNRREYLEKSQRFVLDNYSGSRISKDWYSLYIRYREKKQLRRTAMN